MLPSGVQVSIEGSRVQVKGPRGTLVREVHPEMKVNLDAGQLTVIRPSDEKRHRSLHGLTRTLINNMVVGVTEGYQKTLDIVGVGYRASKQGSKLVMALGYSHPVEIEPEAGLEIECPTQTRIIVRGIDKEKVGALAAKIRSMREPEPYLGKGVKYENEVVRRKVGKTGK